MAFIHQWLTTVVGYVPTAVFTLRAVLNDREDRTASVRKKALVTWHVCENAATKKLRVKAVCRRRCVVVQAPQYDPFPEYGKPHILAKSQKQMPHPSITY